jgi:hypothetical protein
MCICTNPNACAVANADAYTQMQQKVASEEEKKKYDYKEESKASNRR